MTDPTVEYLLTFMQGFILFSIFMIAWILRGIKNEIRGEEKGDAKCVDNETKDRVIEGYLCRKCLLGIDGESVGHKRYCRRCKSL